MEVEAYLTRQRWGLLQLKFQKMMRQIKYFSGLASDITKELHFLNNLFLSLDSEIQFFFLWANSDCFIMIKIKLCSFSTGGMECAVHFQSEVLRVAGTSLNP